MIKSFPKFRVAGVVQNARSRLSGLKQLQLSPLSAMVLAVFSAMTLATALFAIRAIQGPLDFDSGVKVPDWTPPTLAAAELDPPKPDTAYAQSLSRPIFFKNRRPQPKTAAPAQAAALSEEPSGLTVTAIVRHKKKMQAFVISADTPTGEWRQVGDVVDSWTVSAITPAEVVLQSGDRRSEVKLLYSEAPPTAATAAATTAPAPAPEPMPPPGEAPK